MPNPIPLYVIAGPNGAGKTTFATEFLPHFANCREFINADYLAGAISPFAPRAAALEAGRMMLSRMRDLAQRRRGFAFETTLSGRSYLAAFRRFKGQGYQIHLFYLWLPDVRLAIQRVRDRVRQGGHDVPEADIRRRFNRGLKNLFGEYLPLLDAWTLIDNSRSRPFVIAYGRQGPAKVRDAALFEKIKRAAGKA